MSSGEHTSKDQDSSMAAWMKSASNFWLETARTWSGMFSAPAGAPVKEREEQSGTAEDAPRGSATEDAWQTPIRIWQTLFSILSNPSAADGLMKETGALPTVAQKLIDTSCESCSKLYQDWAKRIGETVQGGNPENIHDELYRSWMQLYQKEIQPLLNIPQVGLTRVYQENANQAVDKFNLYQMALSEFVHLLCLPLEKSVKAMEEKFEQLSKEGQLSEDFSDQYNTWIKLLESHYMALFKSPDYLQSLCRTLHTVQDFKMAQHKMLTDVLQTLPIPTNKDMDEVYKELHLLKRKVRNLTKEMEASEPARV